MTGERILVVDDSAQMREFLADMILRPEGYLVETARNGAEGVAAAMANSPDLIITDLAMPELNGLDMTRNLRESGYRMPVILVTAEGSEDLAVEALRLGVMDYFVKPFDAVDMLEAVGRVLRASSIGRVRAGVPDQRRLQALNTLIAIGKSINSLLDLEKILTRVVEAAVYLSGTEEGVLMLIDPETGELYVRAAKNLEDGLQNMRLPVKDSLAGHVIRTGQPLLVAGEGMQEIKTRYLVRSLLYVPLCLQDSTIGVLGVHNRVAERELSQEDAALLAALADYAAIAIINARLYESSERERAQLEQIFDHAADAVFVLDRAGRVVLSNPVARHFFDLLPEGEQPTGRPIATLTGNRSLLTFVDSSLEDGAVEAEIDGAGDRTFQAHVMLVEGIGRVVVMQDITYFMERDRVKSELLEMVSHQVRSPLTAILSYVELLMRTGDLSEQQTNFALQVRSNVKTITETLGDLLDLGRIDSGLDQKFEPVMLGEAADYAVEALRGHAEEKEQYVIVEAGRDVPPVRGNPVRLRQVFINLIDNAIKYTPRGGDIRVSVFEEEGQVVARVSDTGLGIPLDDQPHIFDKFYRARSVVGSHEGTGLGLSIVKSIVEAHGGRVWVDSQTGYGTTCTVVLPTYRHIPRQDGRDRRGS